MFKRSVIFDPELGKRFPAQPNGLSKASQATVVTTKLLLYLFHYKVDNVKIKIKHKKTSPILLVRACTPSIFFCT